MLETTHCLNFFFILAYFSVNSCKEIITAPICYSGPMNETGVGAVNTLILVVSGIGREEGGGGVTGGSAARCSLLLPPPSLYTDPNKNLGYAMLHQQSAQPKRWSLFLIPLA